MNAAVAFLQCAASALVLLIAIVYPQPAQAADSAFEDPIERIERIKATRAIYEKFVDALNNRKDLYEIKFLLKQNFDPNISDDKIPSLQGYPFDVYVLTKIGKYGADGGPSIVRALMAKGAKFTVPQRLSDTFPTVLHVAAKYAPLTLELFLAHPPQVSAADLPSLLNLAFTAQSDALADFVYAKGLAPVPSVSHALDHGDFDYAKFIARQCPDTCQPMVVKRLAEREDARKSAESMVVQQLLGAVTALAKAADTCRKNGCPTVQDATTTTTSANGGGVHWTFWKSTGGGPLGTGTSFNWYKVAVLTAKLATCGCRRILMGTNPGAEACAPSCSPRQKKRPTPNAILYAS